MLIVDLSELIHRSSDNAVYPWSIIKIKYKLYFYMDYHIIGKGINKITFCSRKITEVCKRIDNAIMPMTLIIC